MKVCLDTDSSSGRVRSVNVYLKACDVCSDWFIALRKHHKTCSTWCVNHLRRVAFNVNVGPRRFDQSGKRKTGLLEIGEKNIHSRRWSVRSPRGVCYQFKNLSEFLRAHADLFTPAQLKDWKQKDGCLEHIGRSRAYLGIASLRPSDCLSPRPSSWHGWTWVSIHERRFNDGADLLARNSQ